MAEPVGPTKRRARSLGIPPAVDVYAVGWLASGIRAWRYLTSPNPPRCGRREAWRDLRQRWRYMVHQAKRGNWRAVKNMFNGYLAEHHTRGARCGTGWTKRRALRDLYAHLAEVTRG